MTNYTNLGNLISPAPIVRCGDGAYPVLSMTMHDGIVLQSERFKKSLASSDQSEYKVVKYGQLVVGFPIDEGVLYIQKAAAEGIMSPAYNVWNVDTMQIDPDFLELCLHSPQSMQYYRSKLRGTTARRRSIPTADLLALPIRLPDMEVQKAAVALAQKMEKVITLRKEQLNHMDQLVKSRFIELFGDPVINPMEWPVCELAKHIRFLTSGSRGWAQYFTDSGEYFITIRNVKNCRITLDDVQHIVPPDNAEARRTKVHEGDLLISITADLGRTGVVTREIAAHGGYINQHLTCIRLNQDAVRPLYVAYYMESDAGKGQFQSKNQSAVKAGLNFNAINSLRLLVPPIELQDEFITFVEQTDKSKLCGVMEVAA